MMGSRQHLEEEQRSDSTWFTSHPPLHPKKEPKVLYFLGVLTDVQSLLTGVLHRVQILRGGAGALEVAAHAELRCPAPVLRAANFLLEKNM